MKKVLQPRACLYNDHTVTLCLCRYNVQLLTFGVNIALLYVLRLKKIVGNPAVYHIRDIRL